MSAAPGLTDKKSGTLTFLFTDIEGSAQRWEMDATAMEVAVRNHDELLGEAIAQHDGRLVKQTGDGVFAAFDDAVRAAEAAVVAQEAFSADDWAG